ncbi:MAG TPA: M1 family aminopeptidase [Cyclobacteriaceae bacterium]|nr:M1 family aminopeptidase [Cyclobacteriaceae bacterium]
MFKELFLFELYYRRRRPTSYVYFFLILIICLISITGRDLELGAGRAANATFIITALTVVLSAFFTIITAAIVGVSIIRDSDHDMASLIYSTPVKKGSYLFGRFAGSMTVAIIIHMAIMPGFLLGYLVGPYLPWDVAWLKREMLPFDLWAYVQPFLLFTLTNIFVTGSIFFCVGALVRKPVVIYSQSIIFIMLYVTANEMFLKDPDLQRMAAIIDPFAIHSVVYMTRYWTPLQQNTFVVPFEDVMLWNRLLWVGIGVLVLLFTYWRFSFASRRALMRRSKKTAPVEHYVPQDVAIPAVNTSETFGSRMKQVVLTGAFYARSIWKEVPFIAIAGTGIVVLIRKAASMDDMYGTSSYPTTSAVVSTLVESFRLFFFIVLVFYSGEMIWRERERRINPITDSTPIPTGLMLLSKFAGLAFIYLTFLVIILTVGVLAQASRGYFDVNVSAYFGVLFVDTFINLCLLTVIALLVQILAPNKFMGFVLTGVVYLLVFAIVPISFRLEHDLVSFGSGTLGSFSDMNGFGHFVKPFTWLKIYWTAFAFVIFIPAIILYRRGIERKLAVRWKSGRRRFTHGMRTIAILVTGIFVASGVFIYYNTSILNHFESTHEAKLKQVSYEKELKEFQTMAQPTIVEVNINVDLFPATRSFKSSGYYYLKNNDSVPIGQVEVQHISSPSYSLNNVSFGILNATPSKQNPKLGYSIYDLSTPLLPGDSVRMSFDIDFTQEGFKGKGINTDLVYNGTFFGNSYFPTIGYDRSRELKSDDERKKFDLDPRTVFGKRAADRIRFSAIVSTDSSQTAIAPGELVKDWFENNRHYYQYNANGVPDRYAIISGHYGVKRDNWNDVRLEVYYHPAHNYNVERMIQGLKDGLVYYSKNFGAVPHSQVRIVEFPRYTTFTQSFPGLIAFSEGLGFILKVADPAKDLDVPYYITAHELAHQWWGQQVMEADKAGRALLSEGLAQYSALMVMNKNYAPEQMQLFLQYELNSYLKGRTAEKMREVPLMSAQEQQYISYNKSGLAFFAIQDYIGEDSLNAAFKRFYNKWASNGPPYASSEDLIGEIKTVVPDSLKYLLSDLFDNITLYENAAQEAAYRVLSQGRYEVTITTSTQKLQVDSTGREVVVPINDWIDVGVYGEDGKIVYLKKHKFSRQKNTLTIITRSRPTRVGIDPLYKLIDHHWNDNVIPIGTVVEIANSPLGY